MWQTPCGEPQTIRPRPCGFLPVKMRWRWQSLVRCPCYRVGCERHTINALFKRLRLLVRGLDRGKNSYEAVTVAATANCCDAARATQSRPILVSYCPKLPLPQCTMRDRCRCEFLEWPDRRIGERR